MKNFVFMVLFVLVGVLGLSACSHVDERQGSDWVSPEIVEETDELIPKAPSESDDSDEEIGWPLTQEKYVLWELIVDNFGSRISVSSPATITGSAPRAWFFEWVFPVTLMTLEDEIITESYASGDWLSPIWHDDELQADDMIEFSSTIEFDIPEESTGEAKIRFSKDNTGDEIEVEYVEEIVILVD